MADLRIAYLNCHSLLSIADEVSDMILLMCLLLLRLGWTLLLTIVKFFHIYHYFNIVCSDGNQHGGGLILYEGQVCG